MCCVSDDPFVGFEPAHSQSQSHRPKFALFCSQLGAWTCSAPVPTTPTLLSTMLLLYSNECVSLFCFLFSFRSLLCQALSGTRSEFCAPSFLLRPPSSHSPSSSSSATKLATDEGSAATIPLLSIIISSRLDSPPSLPSFSPPHSPPTSFRSSLHSDPGSSSPSLPSSPFSSSRDLIDHQHQHQHQPRSATAHVLYQHTTTTRSSARHSALHPVAFT